MIEKSRLAEKNLLLKSLPGSAFRVIEPYLVTASIGAGTVLHEVGDEVDHIYFLTSGVMSLQSVTRTGRCVDNAIVGRDGAIAPMVAFGRGISTVRCLARTTVSMVKISGKNFRAAAESVPALSMLCIDCNQHLLAKAQLAVARFALQSTSVRLAACLVDASTLLETDVLPFTQETLAEMLSVRRTSVTEEATKLKDAGIIDYSRGNITVLDRPWLLKLSDL
jgi:CRP-like cAMP-binding protein